IERGDYGVRTWMRCKAEALSFEARWSRERASGWFALALWLAQRSDDGWAGASRAVSAADDGRDPSAKGAVPRDGRQQSDTLGPDRGAGDGGVEDHDDGGAVVERGAAAAEDCGAEQLSLFGDGRARGRC